MLFSKNLFKCTKKNTILYKILIQTLSKNIGLTFFKKFKLLQFQTLPLKTKIYTFIKSPHKYSSSKRQLISQIFTYITLLFLKKKEFFYFRFFLLYFPPGLIIRIKKNF